MQTQVDAESDNRAETERRSVKHAEREGRGALQEWVHACARQVTEELESHARLTAAVSPTRAVTVVSHGPKLRPSNVMVLPPLGAALARPLRGPHGTRVEVTEV
jgi:hypothetical protein